LIDYRKVINAPLKLSANRFLQVKDNESEIRPAHFSYIVLQKKRKVSKEVEFPSKSSWTQITEKCMNKNIN